MESIIMRNCEAYFSVIAFNDQKSRSDFARGNAANVVLWKFNGRALVLKNQGSKTVKIRIAWGGVFGEGPYTNSRLWPGDMETYLFPDGILGVCYFEANNE